jgi:hypothetical protein
MIKLDAVCGPRICSKLADDQSLTACNFRDLKRGLKEKEDRPMLANGMRQ